MEKAISICNEFITSCKKEDVCACPHCCHIESAEEIAEENINGAITICENLSGVNKAHCYYKIIRDVNRTEDIGRLCDHMISVWGERAMVMRYCKTS